MLNINSSNNKLKIKANSGNSYEKRDNELWGQIKTLLQEKITQLENEMKTSYFSYSLKEGKINLLKIILNEFKANQEFLPLNDFDMMNISKNSMSSFSINAENLKKLHRSASGLRTSSTTKLLHKVYNLCAERKKNRSNYFIPNSNSKEIFKILPQTEKKSLHKIVALDNDPNFKMIAQICADIVVATGPCHFEETKRNVISILNHPETGLESNTDFFIGNKLYEKEIKKLYLKFKKQVNILRKEYSSFNIKEESVKLKGLVLNQLDAFNTTESKNLATSIRLFNKNGLATINKNLISFSLAREAVNQREKLIPVGLVTCS